MCRGRWLRACGLIGGTVIVAAIVSASLRSSVGAPEELKQEPAAQPANHDQSASPVDRVRASSRQEIATARASVDTQTAGLRGDDSRRFRAADSPANEPDVELAALGQGPSAYLTYARFDPLCVRIGADTFRLDIGVSDPSVISVELRDIDLQVSGGRLDLARQGQSVTSLMLYDDGTHGDEMPGDQMFGVDELSLRSPPTPIGLWVVNQAAVRLGYSNGNIVDSQEVLRLKLHWIDDSVPLPEVTVVSDDVVRTAFAVNIIRPLTGSFPDHNSGFDLGSVASRYHDVWPDDRDFLLIVLPFNTGATYLDYHVSVRNDIEGIGGGQFDNSGRYGSKGVLQSCVLLNSSNPNARTLNHEILHRWAAHLDGALDLTWQPQWAWGASGHWGVIAAGAGGFGDSPYAGSFDHIEWLTEGDYRAWNEPNPTGAYNELELYLMGLVAADEVLIPVQCQFLAMRGVRALLDTVVRVKNSMNPSLRLGGLFGTMYRPESQHAQEVVDELRSVFGPKMFKTLIHYDDAVAEAPVVGLSVLEYVPRHPIAQGYRALAEEVAGGRQES